MILPAKPYHKAQIVSLWNKAFGDKEEDVSKYLETILKYFLVYEEDGIVKGMLSVLPVTFSGENGGYIYAVTTLDEFRGQGICNKLMEYVKADKKYNFLVLKPQNEGLFDFYEKMGFKRVSCLTKKELLVNPVQQENYKLKKLSALEYESERNAYFGEENLVKWNSCMLDFAKEMYGGEFYALEDKGNSAGIAFAYADKNVAVMKELLSQDAESVAKFIAVELGCEKVKFLVKNTDGEECFMVYPRDKKVGYFNIYFD